MRAYSTRGHGSIPPRCTPGCAAEASGLLRDIKSASSLEMDSVNSETNVPNAGDDTAPREVPFEIRGSTIEGRGAFATQAIEAGARVVEYRGERLRKEDSRVRQEAGNPYIFIIDEEYDIDGDMPWNPARFLNHSCAPNCEAFLEGSQIWIYARRAIAVGEELTFNYGYDISEYADYPCRCGAAECIGFIVAEEHFDAVRAREHGVVIGNAPAALDPKAEGESNRSV